MGGLRERGTEEKWEVGMDADDEGKKYREGMDLLRQR